MSSSGPSVDTRFSLSLLEEGPAESFSSPLRRATSSIGSVIVAEDVGPNTVSVEDAMDPEGLAGPSDLVMKPLTREALEAYQAVQNKAGIIYISRIPPGMRPTKVRHLMSQYGEVGRVYLQQEDPHRAYLRKKYTATKKAHYTEGWVEFKEKRIARSVAEMLNAQPIGGKKGTRWRDDVWTMKYLPKFKWHMLTEQVAHEAAVHAARVRMEISQSRDEQYQYLKNVELARVLDKRAERKRLAGKTDEESTGRKATSTVNNAQPRQASEDAGRPRKKPKRDDAEREPIERAEKLESVLCSIF